MNDSMKQDVLDLSGIDSTVAPGENLFIYASLTRIRFS